MYFLKKGGVSVKKRISVFSIVCLLLAAVSLVVVLYRMWWGEDLLFDWPRWMGNPFWFSLGASMIARPLLKRRWRAVRFRSFWTRWPALAAAALAKVAVDSPADSDSDLPDDFHGHLAVLPRLAARADAGAERGISVFAAGGGCCLWRWQERRGRGLAALGASLRGGWGPPLRSSP